MNIVQRYKTGFQADPVTFLFSAVITLFMLFFGLALYNIKDVVTVYQYQERVMPLAVWGLAFFAGGFITLVRSFSQRNVIIETILHAYLCAVNIAWFLTWIVKSFDTPTALPPALAYGSLTLFCISMPFIAPLARRYRR